MVLALVSLNFLLPRAMPGDPIDGLLGQGAAGFSLGEQSRAALEEYYNLDGSLASQFGNYLSRLVQGDLGRSIVTNAPVTKEIGRRLPGPSCSSGAPCCWRPSSAWWPACTPAGAVTSPWTGRC